MVSKLWRIASLGEYFIFVVVTTNNGKQMPVVQAIRMEFTQKQQASNVSFKYEKNRLPQVGALLPLLIELGR